MHRRALLGTVGATALAGLAGCGYRSRSSPYFTLYGDSVRKIAAPSPPVEFWWQADADAGNSRTAAGDPDVPRPLPDPTTLPTDRAPVAAVTAGPSYAHTLARERSGLLEQHARRPDGPEWGRTVDANGVDIARGGDTVYAAWSTEGSPKHVVAVGLDGTRRWHTTLDTTVYGLTLLQSKRQLLVHTVTTDHRAAVRVLDARDGTDRWLFRTDADRRQTPTGVAATPNRLLLATRSQQSGTVYGATPSERSLDWTAAFDEPVLHVAARPDTVVVTTPSRLVRLDGTTGETRWTRTIAPRDAPALTDTAVYTPTDGGLCRHALDGTERYRAGTAPTARPVVAKGTVYVLRHTDDGTALIAQAADDPTDRGAYELRSEATRLVGTRGRLVAAGGTPSRGYVFSA